MKSTIISIAAALATLTTASPIKRAYTPTPTDTDILNYALTLEHLENAFYLQGLAKYSSADFVAAGFTADNYNKLKTISSDETTHVSFLTNALKAAGATPVEPCTYNFGYNDVKGFLGVASVLEGVGASAYLGAAANIMSKTYLTAAGSILVIEARHSSYLRNALKQEPAPQPFENPLDINQVYTLAAQMIVSCPKNNPALPVKAFPVLTASSSSASNSTITTGSKVMLSAKDCKPEGTVYAAFITVTGPVFVDAKVVNGGFEVVVPKDVKGQSYVVLTRSNTAATDDTIVAGPAIVEISS